MEILRIYLILQEISKIRYFFLHKILLFLRKNAKIDVTHELKKVRMMLYQRD